MAFSASLRTYLPTPYHCHNSKFCSHSLYGRQKRLSVMTCVRRSFTFHTITSVFENSKFSTNSYGASQPARVLLERLLAQTPKLEEGMGRNSHTGLNLETLESDIEAAFEALVKKEEDLLEAERMVMSEQAELTNAKVELERREKEIAAACSRQEKLEDELRQANLRLISQAREIEDLKLQLRERDLAATALQLSLTLKEDELEKVGNDLIKMSEEAATAESEHKSKGLLLDEANRVLLKQEIELLELQNMLQLKEKELEMALSRQQLEVEKLKVTEAKLEVQTRQWLLAQEELRKLGEEASRNMEEGNQTMEDFKRVKQLLAEMWSELVSSQKSLVSSQQKMAEGELLLEKQLAELEEQKQAITSYMKSLKDAQVEVEGEGLKIRTLEARNKELEKELSVDRQLMEILKEELHDKRSYLQQAIQEISQLQLELDRKNAEFRETSNILQVKESELVEARLENQHLKSEQESLRLILEERDLELCTARKRLAEVNAEVAELRMLMQSKEDELKLSASLIQEREDFAQAMQHELSAAKLKCSEAESIIERIVNLTSKLVVFTNEDDTSSLQKLLQQESEGATNDYSWQKKQLKAELELTRDNLRSKEIEVLAMQRALAVKDEELKTVLQKLDEKERELKQRKEEMPNYGNDLKKLHALAEERIGGRSMADLAIEKLQLEAAQLEVEAATSALEKLAEMSRELVNKASSSIEFDVDTSISLQKGFDLGTTVENDQCFATVRTEVAHLSALTQRLVQEAGIIGTNH